MRFHRKSILVWIILICVAIKCYPYVFPLQIDLTQEAFLEHDACPACFGTNLCAPIFKSQIQLTNWTRFSISRLMNAKNVFYGNYKFEKVILKKLGHDHELRSLDGEICQAYKERPDCDAGRYLKFLTKEYTLNLGRDETLDFRPLARHEWTEVLSCMRSQALIDLIVKKSRLHESAPTLEQILTLLILNPEPLIFSVFREDDNWPFPKYHGSCGRLAVFQDEGKPLSEFYSSDWNIRVLLSKQLLSSAMKFVRNDLNVALYYTDWISDNFAVNQDFQVKFVDGENFILVDQSEIRALAAPGWNISHTSDGFQCESRFCYSTADLCTHAESDHNIYGLCKGLLAPGALDYALPEGLLHSIPSEVTRKHPLLPRLIGECASPTIPGGRFEAAQGLMEILSQL
ncbi:hypothetical protein TCAL_11442 [Tigriopus californicus]|uniref:FAM69 protein-kinase domain-containing protein n=2 Tax=Tigriopus californicus TaxID=6832 RepID=A0A553NNX5_TIGCA|nr:hypothetical protein TCAL_11442 [Tigriopus californicus]|eukprot:TCALIF_11442-PA protein Name:"Similar to C3orf58 Deleted in autism protein 1 (Homo sapiens)" AED:0.33 eAED:0.33 QI:0/-1/0/1/-1/1/1/0/400